MRDEILLGYEKQIRENKEAIEAFTSLTDYINKGYNFMAVIKTMNNVKGLSDQREVLVNGLLEYILLNYSD